MPWFRRWASPRPPLVPVLLPEPLATEVDELLRRDERLPAIRLVRERTGLDLVSAHRAVLLRQESGGAA